jgi:hypothetical protein
MPAESKSKGPVALAFAAALLAAPALTGGRAADDGSAITATSRDTGGDLTASAAALQHLEKTASQIGWWPWPRPWQQWFEIGPVWVESIPPPILT